MAARIGWSLPIVTMLSAAVGVLWPQPVRADLEVYLQEDSGPKVLVADNHVDFDPHGVGFNGTFGDFLVHLFGATSVNASPSDLMSWTSSIKNQGNKPHTLTIYVSQNNYTLPAGPLLDLTSHIMGTVMSGGSGQKLTFQSYANNSNGLFDTAAPVATTGPQSPVISVTHSPYDSEPDPSAVFVRTSGLYSITTTNALTLAVGGTLSFTTNTELANALSGAKAAATPAPAGLVLVLAALPALGIGGWLRRRHSQASGALAG
jgi:hypothetical protein